MRRDEIGYQDDMGVNAWEPIGGAIVIESVAAQGSRETVRIRLLPNRCCHMETSWLVVAEGFREPLSLGTGGCPESNVRRA
ncbi:MAG: hypothetical protein KDA47_12285, partial [Planctomycetales bacterium]|nr:hypothetical protein [Planctomycetales bacterium]